MLKFDNLIDFINYNKECPFCKKECSIKITDEFSGINASNYKFYNLSNLKSIYYPRQNFPSFILGSETAFLDKNSEDKNNELLKKIGVVIELNENYLNFLTTIDDGKNYYLLFEVDLKTSKISWTSELSKLDISENYLFNYLNFKFIKFCNNSLCQSYVCNSSKIYYGIKNKIIMPFFKKTESIQADSDNKIYLFNTNYNKRKTSLIVRDSKMKVFGSKFYKEYDEIDISKLYSNDSVIDKAEQYMLLS